MEDLTTVAAAKAWLSVVNGGDDTLLQRLVTAVSAAIERRIGRNILTASYTETRNGTGKCILALPNTPVTAVASVAVDGVLIAPRSVPTSTGFSFDDAFVYLAGFTFSRGQQNVVVAYTGGYATIPTDLEGAVLEIVGYKYRERSRIGEGSKQLGAGETVAFLRDIPPDTLRMIDAYKRVIPMGVA